MVAEEFTAHYPPVANDSNWPDAGAPTIDFNATLPTVNLHLQ